MTKKMPPPATKQPSPPASPVCYLPESSDIYAGYLANDEVRSLIHHWIARSPRPEIAELLTALLPAIPAQGGAPQPTTESRRPDLPPATANSLQIEIRQALPRIRDDEMHRALARIADSI